MIDPTLEWNLFLPNKISILLKFQQYEYKINIPDTLYGHYRALYQEEKGKTEFHWMNVDKNNTKKSLWSVKLYHLLLSVGENKRQNTIVVRYGITSVFFLLSTAWQLSPHLRYWIQLDLIYNYFEGLIS